MTFPIFAEQLKLNTKKMADRAIGFLYYNTATRNISSSPRQIINDFNEAGLGNPEISRVKKVLTNDKRTKMIKKNEWILKSDFFENVEKMIDISSSYGNKYKNSNRKQLFNKYELHPIIKTVAANHFQDGYYKEAIQNAFVEVINQVKIKTNNPKKDIGNGKFIEYDGDSLMHYVFGCDSREPIIKFNNLESSLDKAEQQGIMNLYKGIVGIRDKKAHLNFIQNDPIKSLEYLSLASLLLRLLDEYSEQ